MQPSESYAEPLTVPDPSPSTPERDEASGVDHSGPDDVYERAARALSAHGAYESPEVAEFYAVARAKRPAFRAAVDAAREDLAAELARVTAELGKARARVADLEAEQQNGEWVTEYGREVTDDEGETWREWPTDYTWSKAYAPVAGPTPPGATVRVLERRRWRGPVTPTADTTGDQQ